MKYKLGSAKREHVNEITQVFRRSRTELLTFLPQLHSIDEDLAFFLTQVWPKNEIVVALDNDTIVGFIAYRKDHISHLYLLPEYIGLGIGKALLDNVKETFDRLELWVFQDNRQAINFYSSNGFKIVEETDGRTNEEGLPDLRMVWWQKS